MLCLEVKNSPERTLPGVGKSWGFEGVLESITASSRTQGSVDASCCTWWWLGTPVLQLIDDR